MTTESDASLVAAARAGDHAAFAALYDRYADRVHAFAFSRLRDADDAADVLQNTFIRVHERLDSIDDPDKFRPWLFAIARNTIIDAGRDRSRRSALVGHVANEAVPDVAADQASPHRAMEAAETGALLWTAAKALQPRDQELLELHLRVGLEGAELAAAMEVDASHLYVMVKRMKERLSTAVGSLLVARLGRGECPQLSGLLDGWEGTFSLAIRAQVTRHVEQCDTCHKTRRAAIAWESIAAAMPAPPAPIVVRSLVLAAVGGAVLAPAAVGSSAATASTKTSGAGSAVATVTASVLLTVITTAGVVAWPAVFPSDDVPTVQVAGVVEESTPTAVPSSTTVAITTGTTAAPPTSIVVTTRVPVVPPPAATTVPVRTPRTSIAPPPTTSATPTTAAPTTTAAAPTTTAPATTASPTTTVSPTTTISPTTTAAPAPPALVTDPAAVDFGADLTTLTVIVTNNSSRPISWSAETRGDPGFSVDAAKGTTQAGASTPITISFSRDAVNPPPEDDYIASLRISEVEGTASANVALGSAVEVPPAMTIPSGDALLAPSVIFDAGCATGGALLPTSTTVTVRVHDESGPLSVRAEWLTGFVDLAPDPSDPQGLVWTGVVAPEAGTAFAGGEVTMTISVTATDARANSTVVTGSLTIQDCGPQAPVAG